MPKNLIIVESPAKAKTIEKFLSSDYIVKSSYGHIRDLPKSGLNVDIEHDFKPNYEISLDKKKVVNELKKLTKDKKVYLASDEDREGEAIAWHLAQALGLSVEQTDRIVFHEITKPAIVDALKKPRHIDMALVDAQQARRVLDRLVGYQLSNLLWQKISNNLSAGRVQSIAVKLIVDRENEINDFQESSSYKITATLKTTHSEQFEAQLDKNLQDIEIARNWLNDVKNSQFSVENIKNTPSRRSPAAPFTTSSLQQEAARRLGYSVRQTMSIAQKLYEDGHITYMRTDSTNLSILAINMLEDHIKQQYGLKYYQKRIFKTKDKNAQEAHEAIRPTNISQQSIAGLDTYQAKLYNLIWRRTVASQMSDALLDKTEIIIKVNGKSDKLIARGETIVFDGFYAVLGGAKEDVLLPKVQVNQELELVNLKANLQFKKAPARYNEASLVKKLEELGIGRPSTYAPTISVIQNRGYVEKKDLEGKIRTCLNLELQKGQIIEKIEEEKYGADRNKLIPTPIASITTNFLNKYFPEIVNYKFTAEIENEFDEIALGKIKWQKMIADFYKTFKPNLDKTLEIPRKEVSEARLIGHDPKTNLPIYARFGRHGPMLQKGETTDEAKPSFAPLPKNTTIENVSLSQALKMFELPRTLGEDDNGQTIITNIGRFGPYLKINDQFISIKDYDPYSISLSEALIIIKDKKAQDAKKTIKDFGNGLKILNGPYGPYLTNSKKNVRLDKDKDHTKLSLKEAEELLAKAPAKRNRFKKRSKSTKK